MALPTLANSTSPPVDGSGRSEVTLEELIASCYRPLKTGELGQLKSHFPNEEILKEKLTALRDSGGGAEGDMDIEFLASVLEQQVV